MKRWQENSSKPAISVDVVVFTVKEDALNILMLKANDLDALGKWVLPGSFVHLEEKLSEAAKRTLLMKANIDINYLAQLYTFGEDTKRDTRFRVISVGYYALVDYKKFSLKTTPRYSEIAWFPVKNLPQIGYDHGEIVEQAITRIRNKLQYSNVACHLLPKAFTLTQLQRVYEAVLSRKLDKRNFRRKVLNIGIIREVDGWEENVAYRPAKLYQFISKEYKEVEIV